ncbi:hypothetical protein [Pseudovibrio sp. Ad26]|uniref:hypothetical protein n=1 Tax=Pseudovibrio sp. Ad26 TaxID=989410 RepID=UPI0007AEDE8E|nr:hypothetical protein [Pseudovibrio sp. Ad26]KZL12454.1 hypothetical protein PsAD26_02527 [Pseudovibrio sp. Ad26]
MNKKDIAECFFKYAKAKGNPYESFPLRTEVDEFGGPYLEISPDGKMAIVAKDRGKECFRKETDSPAELAEWVYQLFNSN